MRKLAFMSRPALFAVMLLGMLGCKKQNVVEPASGMPPPMQAEDSTALDSVVVDPRMDVIGAYSGTHAITHFSFGLEDSYVIGPANFNVSLNPAAGNGLFIGSYPATLHPHFTLDTAGNSFGTSFYGFGEFVRAPVGTSVRYTFHFSSGDGETHTYIGTKQ